MYGRHTKIYGMATLIYRNNVRYAQRLLREPPDYGTWKAVRNFLQGIELAATQKA